MPIGLAGKHGWFMSSEDWNRGKWIELMGLLAIYTFLNWLYNIDRAGPLLKNENLLFLGFLCAREINFATKDLWLLGKCDNAWVCYTVKIPVIKFHTLILVQKSKLSCYWLAHTSLYTGTFKFSAVWPCVLFPPVVLLLYCNCDDWCRWRKHVSFSFAALTYSLQLCDRCLLSLEEVRFNYLFLEVPLECVL